MRAGCWPPRTDGVGTKLEIARLAGRLDTVGIDLVAMCADDVACTGAEPLFFLDYLAVGRVVPTRVASIVEGVAEGCRRAGCALLGGETAEHPGMMPEDAFDLAGFCVGLVDEDDAARPRPRHEGDVADRAGVERAARERLFARAIGAPPGLRPRATPPTGLDRPLADELLEPCAIYAPEVVRARARRDSPRGRSHHRRRRPREPAPGRSRRGWGRRSTRGTWPEHPIFALLQEAAGASDDDMFATFNMGIGMVLLVAHEAVEAVLTRSSHPAFRIGEVSTPSGVRLV